jgi:BirA family biotin operon repressor/biotin-[acetyl-CoA-carboxylase] ligase
VILGVGVNLNVRREALRAALGAAAHAATSLREEAGREIDRSTFASAVLSALDRWYAIWTARGAEPVLEAWRDRDILTGRRVEVRNGHTSPVDGRVRGVGRDGMLVVEDSRGVLHQVASAEIRLAD